MNIMKAYSLTRNTSGCPSKTPKASLEDTTPASARELRNQKKNKNVTLKVKLFNTKDWLLFSENPSVVLQELQ